MKRKKDDGYSGPPKEKQRELFAEYEKLRTKRPGHIFRQDIALGKKISFQLSYENLILFFIALIMLFVVFFSLGVEKGKKINMAGGRIATEGETVQLAKKETPTAEKRDEATESDVRGDGKIKPMEEIGRSSERGQPMAASAKPYTIQVIAFKKGQEIKAEKELDRLKKDGHEAFTISSGEWIQVCAGRYASKEETKKDYESLKSRYPTCYVRKVSN